MDVWLLIGMFVAGYITGSFFAGFSYAKKGRKELDKLQADIEALAKEMKDGN